MNDSNRIYDRNIEDTGKLLTQSGAGNNSMWKGLMIAAVAVAMILIISGIFLVISNI